MLLGRGTRTALPFRIDAGRWGANRRRTGRTIRTTSRLLVAGASTLTLAAVGLGSGVAGASGGGTLTFAMDQAFTGGTAIDGIAEASGCYPAVLVVNGAGGVLGHKIQCIAVDTRGDPSDAIPATEKMLATTSTLVGVLGPESSTATAIVPILTRAHIPMITQDGLSLYTHNKDPYFWRNYPADDFGGEALAYWAIHKGLKRGALLFDNTVAAQASVPGLLSTYKRLGGKVVIDLKVTPDSTSYGSEMHRLLQAKPQVIFTESDPQTDATAFRNLLELGKPLPIYGTNATVIPDWLKDATKALGKANMSKYYRGVEPYAPTYPGTKTFDKELQASANLVKTWKTWIGQEYSTTPYDSVIIYCLAMTAADSTDPAVFNKDILSVTAPGKGKDVVYSYSAGVKALKAGKKIQYIGASGPTVFNKYHNSFGEYGVYSYVNGNLKLTGTIPAATLSKLPG
jgi:ABC-type branched-subunit amino acid transport system substrate-binding protein